MYLYLSSVALIFFGVNFLLEFSLAFGKNSIKNSKSGSSKARKEVKHIYTPFQDPIYGDFGLRDENKTVCLYLKFHARLYNFNIKGVDIASELTDLTLPEVKLSGKCTLPGKFQKSSQVQATWEVRDRKKTLQFEFQENFVKTLAHQVDELRWQLKKVSYSEFFIPNSTYIKFESANDTNVISAPLRQKFVCKDRLNISLFAKGNYEKIVLEFLPEIDFQPVNAGSGYGSNVYVCERTRRRTLAESFQSKMTIFSGFVLGTSSVGAMVGYSLRRHFMPSRQQYYHSLQ